MTVPFILATSGHVDHGKSALVRALTGIDPDRLPEEKSRGITIDLGFANLLVETPSAKYQLGIIDVPGHEDFVRNMVAGIGSIDLALLVVAADDGWMPQTEEHLQILMYLGVRRGVVALSKIDLAQSESGARDGVREKLRGSSLADAPIIPTSIVSGRGIAELKEALGAVLADLRPQRDIGKPRLPVDRVFTIKGAGTVVTGTLTGGKLRRGQPIILQPSGRTAYVRSIQTHNHAMELALPGSRVALNLPELAVDSISRGDVVSVAGAGEANDTLDVLLERTDREQAGTVPHMLKDGARVHVHIGSGDFAAKVQLCGRSEIGLGERSLAELRLDVPVFAFAGDRLIVRDWPGQHTLAGGVVLDADARRRGFRSPARQVFLQARADHPEDARVFVQTVLSRDMAAQKISLLAKSRFGSGEVEDAVKGLMAAGGAVNAGEWVVAADRWEGLLRAARAAVDGYHAAHPQRLGIPIGDLRASVASLLPAEELFDPLMSVLGGGEYVRVGAIVRRRSHRPTLPPHLREAGERIRKLLASKPLEPPSRKELERDAPSKQAVHFLLDTGEAIAIGDDLVLLAESLTHAREGVTAHLQRHQHATASELKQALGTTRRVMMPLLEYLDQTGVTTRRGDLRVLRGT